MRSNVAQATPLRSTSNGLKHWWKQRFTAIAMVPLSIWILQFLIRSHYMKIPQIMEALKAPYNLVPAMMFTCFGLYHGLLGMEIVIEDYIHCPVTSNTLVIVLRLVTIATIMAGMFAMVRLLIS